MPAPNDARPKEDLRDLDARLKQIVASLPASIVYNPLMTLFAAVPFIVGPDTFGYISVWNIIVVVGIQLVTSVVTRVIYRANKDVVRDLHAKQRDLVEIGRAHV